MSNSVLSVNKSAAEVSLLASPESPASGTLQAIELLSYTQLFSKISLSNQVLGVSTATDTCNVVILFQTKKKERKKKWKLQGKASFVLWSVGCIFYSIKAETFGPIYPSLLFCSICMNCSVSHGDRSHLYWRLKSAYMVFTLVKPCTDLYPVPFLSSSLVLSKFK